MVSGQKKVPKTSSLKSCLLSGIGRCSSPSARRPLSFRLRTLHTNLQLWYFTHFVSKCLLQAETPRTIRLTHPVFKNPVVSVRNPPKLIYSKTLLFPYEIRQNSLLKWITMVPLCFLSNLRRISYGNNQGKALINELLGLVNF